MRGAAAVRYRPVFRAKLRALVPGPLSRVAMLTSSSTLGVGLIALIAISYRPSTLLWWWRGSLFLPEFERLFIILYFDRDVDTICT